MTSTTKKIPKRLADQLDRMIWKLESWQQHLPQDSEIEHQVNRAKTDLIDVLDKIRK